MESKDFSPLKYRGIFFNENKFRFHYEEWDEQKNKWRHKWTTEYLDGTKRDFFAFDNERQNGVFMILDCKDATLNSRLSEIHKHLNIVCNTYVGKYAGVEPNWADDWLNPIFEIGGFGEKFGASIENPKHNFVFQDTHIVFSGRPNFYISYTNLADLNKPVDHENKFLNVAMGYEVSDELEDLYIKQHPHFCARTLGELFRLIIDWDLAYHHFNNKENIAYICHKILGSIEMPHEIYEDICNNIPDSVVAKYIKGDPDACNMGERPKTPESVIDWLRDKYWDLRNTLNDDVPNVGEVVENHYYKRYFITK